ncbi:uncharacterized protein ACNS7B_006793 [Menidia menidia]|uniref:(Atlantic silverside) hypothetical protein n=1 Tax=Menidia menidia TaxID=238744 RepID=A0A8S4B9T7_9TELE|nr:unnamed protein product [Menidia menidia]
MSKEQSCVSDMLPEEGLPVEEREKHSNPADGNKSLKSSEEILSTCDPVGGNTRPPDFISAQPGPAAAPPAAASGGAAVIREKPTCPRCGLTVPDQRPPPGPPGQPGQPGLDGLQGSSSSVHSSRSKAGAAGPHQGAPSPADLLLACLWCRGSVLVLGVLEACSSCLQGLCPSCCGACARCCSGLPDAGLQELSCHAHCPSALFQSCCQPAECLEFCLECCQICHRS